MPETKENKVWVSFRVPKHLKLKFDGATGSKGEKIGDVLLPAIQAYIEGKTIKYGGSDADHRKSEQENSKTAQNTILRNKENTSDVEQEGHVSSEALEVARKYDSAVTAESARWCLDMAVLHLNRAVDLAQRERNTSRSGRRAAERAAGTVSPRRDRRDDKPGIPKTG